MVAAPLLRGLLGMEATDGGPGWPSPRKRRPTGTRVAAHGVAVADGLADLALSRAPGRATITVTRRPTTPQPGGLRLTLGMALPLDASLSGATVGGRTTQPTITRVGDVQRVEVNVDATSATTDVVFTFTEGTDVYLDRLPSEPGAVNEGLRVLRSRAERSALLLRLEGRAGRDYAVTVRTPARVGDTPGVVRAPGPGRDVRLTIRFDGADGEYVRRDVRVPLLRP